MGLVRRDGLGAEQQHGAPERGRPPVAEHPAGTPSQDTERRRLHRLLGPGLQGWERCGAQGSAYLSLTRKDLGFIGRFSRGKKSSL